MSTFARTALGLLLASGLLVASMAPASAQKVELATVKSIDDQILNKRNCALLCKPQDGRLWVDKDKLEFFFKMNYQGEELWVGGLTGWLNHHKSKLYSVHISPLGRIITAQEFFASASYQIECKPEAAPDTGGDQAAGTDPAAKLLKKVIVRKGVADIKAKSDDISKVNPATLSYARDDVAKTRTLTGEGLVGVAFTGSAADDKKSAPGSAPYWYSIVPYVYTKQFDVEPNSNSKKDISYVMPGIAGNLILVTPDLRTSLAIQLDASTTIDDKQDSLQSIATLRLAPGFTIGNMPVLRAPLPLVGNLALYPEVAGVFRQFLIHDAGTNPDLVGKTSFSSVGFDATTLLYWTDTSTVLSTFVLKAGYIYRDSSGTTPDVIRRTAGLSVAPFGNKNVTVELDYAHGRDENTFQLEQRWSAGLGIRY